MPLTDGEFAAAMTALGPFEAAPALAVAVSGGPDSMALCLLADTWARARGGGVLALIVDHGLRPGSAGETRRAAAWLFGRGIASEILPWSGDKPATAIHARARRARYRLLADRCRERGLLHLLVGHQLEDQAETLLLRQAAGSGLAGLAGMSALVETGAVRVLRPLLDVRKRRLRAYLAGRGQAWIEDPSNTDPRFARAQVREALPSLAETPDALSETAARYRGLRQLGDDAVAALLARHCRLHPLGFVRLDAAMVGAADEASVDAALGRVAATVGGTAFPPAARKLLRLRRHLLSEAPAAISLGRCIWQASPGSRGTGGEATVFQVFRESRGLPAALRLVPDREVEWDGRFLVRVGSIAGRWAGGLRLEALGEAGWPEALRLSPLLRDAVPRRPALSLPVLRDERGLLAVPVLGLYREPGAEAIASVRFRPRRSLSGAGYYLA